MLKVPHGMIVCIRSVFIADIIYNVTSLCNPSALSQCISTTVAYVSFNMESANTLKTAVIPFKFDVLLPYHPP